MGENTPEPTPDLEAAAARIDAAANLIERLLDRYGTPPEPSDRVAVLRQATLERIESLRADLNAAGPLGNRSVSDALYFAQGAAHAYARVLDGSEAVEDINPREWLSDEDADRAEADEQVEAIGPGGYHMDARSVGFRGYVGCRYYDEWVEAGRPETSGVIDGLPSGCPMTGECMAAGDCAALALRRSATVETTEAGRWVLELVAERDELQRQLTEVMTTPRQTAAELAGAPAKGEPGDIAAWIVAGKPQWWHELPPTGIQIVTVDPSGLSTGQRASLIASTALQADRTPTERDAYEGLIQDLRTIDRWDSEARQLICDRAIDAFQALAHRQELEVRAHGTDAEWTAWTDQESEQALMMNEMGAVDHLNVGYRRRLCDLVADRIEEWTRPSEVSPS